MARAVRALPEMPQHVFVDGRDKVDAPCGCDALIGGDGIVLSIAAASIVAKVTRDRLMCALARIVRATASKPTRATRSRNIARRWTGWDRAFTTADSLRR